MVLTGNNNNLKGMFSLENKRVWIAGHTGMVGNALVKRLSKERCRLLSVGRDELDLTNQDDVQAWLKNAKPDVIIIAAARVGGINVNNMRPVDFLYDNLMIQSNIMNSANHIGVQRLLFLGSSCIYPKYSQQPIKEESLLTGPLEPTNEWYAIAKIAGIKLIQAYRKQYNRDWISAMPTNLYGPGDNYDLDSSHVLAALIRKFHEAKISRSKEIILWGSGSPLREFMHCDDLADALIFLTKNYSDSEHINIGSGYEISICELAEKISKLVGCNSRIIWDKEKPDGTPQKLMDSSRLNKLGWNKCRDFDSGLKETYHQFLKNEFKDLHCKA